MKKYWLYVESYTMIFSKDHTFLFYNTISGQHFMICPGEFLFGILEKLQEIDNGYCAELTEHELNLQETIEFINQLRESFCGDAIDQEFVKMKPFSLYPVCSVMKNREILKTNPYLSLGEKILEFLHVFTIQITGICELKCQFCSNLQFQTISCSSSDNELEYEFLDKIFTQISGSELRSLNIIGGNLFRYTKWEKLIFLLQNYFYLYYWYTDYRNLLANEAKLQDIKSLNVVLKITVPGEFEHDHLEKALKMVSDIDFELIFYITSEEHCRVAECFCENQQIENYTFHPVFSKTNIEFFRNFIYMKEESILASPVSKQTIFANMNLNTVDFGKLTILSNGDVYANPNFNKLGNIQTDSIRQILYEEFKQGESWFRIRNKKPCVDCIYQWLCPPPTNYEFAIGKPNLCHVK